MKKIKCLRNIAAIKILDEIINFDSSLSNDKIAEVPDHIAEILSKLEGYELVDDETRKTIVKRLDDVSKKVSIKLWDRVKKFFGGNI